MKPIAVVILNWNGRELLERFLPSVVKHSTAWLADVYVADNGSTDDSVAFLKGAYPEVQILSLSCNYGFAGGYNQALKDLDHEFFLLLNSDVEVTAGWLEPLLDCLHNEPDVAAVMPKIRDYYNRNSFEYAGAAGGYLDSLGLPYCRGRIFGAVEDDVSQYDQPVDVHWTSGAAMLIRAKMFHFAGGFDDSFFAHMEEIDLCWRLMNQGARLRCIPASMVYHAGGATLSYQSARKVYLNARNSLITVYKNHPRPFFALLIRAAIDVLAFFALLFSGRGWSALSVLRANIDCYGMLRLKKRQTINQHKVYYKLHPKSILFNYFILRKKTYCEQ